MARASSPGDVCNERVRPTPPPSSCHQVTGAGALLSWPWNSGASAHLPCKLAAYLWDLWTSNFSFRNLGALLRYLYLDWQIFEREFSSVAARRTRTLTRHAMSSNCSKLSKELLRFHFKSESTLPSILQLVLLNRVNAPALNLGCICLSAMQIACLFMSFVNLALCCFANLAICSNCAFLL